VNYLDAGNLTNLDIPLGMRSVKAGQQLCLLIQGQTFFAAGEPLCLYDKLEDKRYNLRGTTWFYFDNPTTTGQLDDRFVIEVGLRNGNGVEAAKPVQKSIISKSYFDLTGRPVPEHAAKGLLIQKSVYDDGTTGYGKAYVN
jgi:hypothetical protein